MKRSKLTKAAAAGAGLGVATWLRDPARRERLRRMAVGIRDTLLPREAAETPQAGGAAAPGPVIDEAHAPGHRHLPPPDQKEPPAQATGPAEHTVVSHQSGHVHKG